jgi:HNH endonuclease
MTPLERFEAKYMPEPNSGCWLWMGSIRGQGYAQTGVGERYAHRFSYEHYKGKIPEGMRVLHKCDTPTCVNPDHLFLGTAKDNTHDALKKGRLKKSSKSGRFIP